MLTTMLTLLVGLVPTGIADLQQNPTERVERPKKPTETVKRTIGKKTQRAAKQPRSTSSSRSTQTEKQVQPKAKEPPSGDENIRKTKSANSAAAHTQTTALEIDVVVDGIQGFYRDAVDLKASFKQSYTYTVYGRTQVSTGRVYFKKPGRMRWDYQAPSAKVFVSDGDLLWVYEPEENQAYRRPLKGAQIPVALSFMTGEGDLNTSFKTRLIESTAQHYRVELLPRKDEGDYKQIELTVDREQFVVRKSVVIDAVGNRNVVDFETVQINTGIAEKAFKFDPPEGVRIIKD